MNPNENYTIENDRVLTRSLEFHIVDHCNLRCWGCCSLSPISPKQCTPPETIKKHLSQAVRALSPSRLKLVGGEPLLHPEIDSCLEIARSSNIAPSVSVTTNGFLLPKMTETFWQLVDHMTISLYPEPALPKKTISKIEELASSHGVELNWKVQNSFVGMDRDQPDLTGIETTEIYSSCWLRRRCHLIAHGRFYTCTRPSHVHAVSGLEQSPYLEDGIPLGSAQDIYQYLIKKEALATCALCLGGDAKSEKHRQLSPDETRSERLLRQNLYRDYAARRSDNEQLT